MLPKEETKINMTEGWLFKFYATINLGTNEFSVTGAETQPNAGNEPQTGKSFH